jgi:hypothetical protein
MKGRKRIIVIRITFHGSVMLSRSLLASPTFRTSFVQRSCNPCQVQERRRDWPRITSSMLLGCEQTPRTQLQDADRETLHRYTPIFEQDFKEQIFSRFYESNATLGQDPIEAHKLALLFFVFAMGKLTDPRTQVLSTQEAMKYFHIGKAVLTLNQSLESPSIPLLQGLLIMCHFMFLANIGGSRWLTMGIIVKLSQSVCTSLALSLV